jgi:sulfite reductase alpha subunit-like flavoprotein
LDLGAEKKQEIGLGNDKDEDKYETAFSAWLPDFWTIQNAPESEAEKLISNPIVALEPVEDQEQTHYVQVQPPKTKMLTLEKNVRITPSDYNRIIRHLVFDVEGKDFSYLLGDALTIYPDNDSAKVNEFLDWYGVDKTTVYDVKALKQLDARRAASFKHAMTNVQLFGEVVDILGRPSKNFYKQLRKFATDPKDQVELDLLISESPEGQAKYSQLTAEAVNYAEVLRMFPSAKPSVEHLVSLIPCIKPRLYSIASSQRLINDKVELVIVILDWMTAGGKARRGLSTNYIDRIATDSLPAGSSFTVPCSVTPGTFKFPESLQQPYVMTGLGTGLAPFRAFVQERAYFKRKGADCGPMWLFYGCRYRAKDYIFGDELEAYHKEGVLTELRPAFSRDQKEKIYVQHRMLEAKDRLYEDLIKKNGFFYLCGQAGQLERDVRSALTEAFKHGEKCSPAEADEKFVEFDESGRYCTELY